MTILFCLFQLAACNSADSESNITPSETDKAANLPTADKGNNSIKLIYCHDVESDGVVTISFNKGEQEYTGLTNAKGEIFYYSSTSFSIKSIGNNYGYITQSNNRGILNYETGDVTWFSADAFDNVIGSGDGFLFTFKNNSTVSTKEYVYSVIDAKTGKEVKKNTTTAQLQHPYTDNSTTQSDYVHVGGGWFLSVGTSYDITKGDDWLYDSNNNLSYILDDGAFLDSSFINGKIRFYSSDNWIWYQDASGKQRSIDLPYTKNDYFALVQSTGNVELSSGVTELNYDNVEYLTFTDPDTQTTIEYTNLPSQIISYLTEEYENYFLVVINGEDDKDYFTVIDKKGVQTCETIEYYRRPYSTTRILIISEDRVIYKVENEWGKYLGHKIFDVSGKELFTIQQGSEDESDNVLIEFHNGITVNENKIIDKFGNELQLTIKQ